jgi:hypothetical protein
VEYFSFRNFRQFERTRSEIRLPCDLLLDQRFRALPDVWKGHLVCLLLLSARMDNILPMQAHKLESLIGATEPVELEALEPFVRLGLSGQLFKDPCQPKVHVPDVVRVAVLVRDGARCRRCRSASNLEIDHLVPISKGGGSDESNLQVLCRRCNRRKAKNLVAKI